MPIPPEVAFALQWAGIIVGRRLDRLCLCNPSTNQPGEEGTSRRLAPFGYLLDRSCPALHFSEDGSLAICRCR